jgi:hypothetical protein
MPRAASPALQTLINSEAFLQFDVYTFTLSGGGLLLLTDATFDISDGGINLWPRNGPIILDDQSPQRGHWKCGLDVDTWSLALAPRSSDPLTGAAFPDKIGGQPMLSAIRSGALDGADVLVQRAFFPEPSLGASTLISTRGVVPTGFLTWFRGLVSDVESAGGTATVLIQDHRVLFADQMPRNIYQAGCEHTLYDSGCKLSAAAFAKTGTVTSAASRKSFATSTPAPGGSGDYTLGRVMFTSGANSGLIRMIRFWDGATFIETVSPFPHAVTVGDHVTMYPGCPKTTTACTAFGNLVNFGGDPFIPPPTVTGGSTG